MTMSFRAAPLALILALCRGCANSRGYVPIQLASTADIAIVQATAHAEVDGIVIGGDVRRPNGFAERVPGYLHITGRDRSGSVVATTDTYWGEFMNRRFRLAYFKAFLQAADPAAIKEISIEPVTGQ